ncbi:MAG: aminodeoxychorismate synthase component I [Magnetovibrio sp.]|nr:aminodeoxychorismate synthase component I [Magnetovibrio sp.]
MAISPLSRPIPYDDPIRVFAALGGAQPDGPVSALFDSAGEVGGRGRYSYIAVDPCETVPNDGDPFAALAEALGAWRLVPDPGLPPFQGGAAGYLGYELGGHLERLPPSASAGCRLPEMVMAVYDTVVAFDHQSQSAWAVAVDVPGAEARVPAAVRLDEIAARIERAPELPPLDWTPQGAWRPEVARADFEAMIAETVEYIHAGDIFQANITQRFLGERPADLPPFMLYRRLRELSANPYGAYLQCGPDAAVASASPEMFLDLDHTGSVVTRPIKGTRPRGGTAADDRALSEALLASEKDRAENLMIVDLMRNDLGRVCRIGSVGVTELCGLETFASIHHLVSEVTGTLMPGTGPVDLLRAAFPGGSVTGAPKVRAMEIINELEPARRGPYCGAIAWIGFDGAMHASIVIRTLVVDGTEVVAQAGGGIVADSDPAAEYAESLDKAAVLLSSLDPDWRDRGTVV